MTRMAGPDCAVMYNLINILTYIELHTYVPYIHTYQYMTGPDCAVMCVCVFFPFILDIKFVGRTSRGHTGGRSHRISHPPSFCLNFSRDEDSAIPFPRRP